MYKKIVLAVVGLLCSSSIWAFNCYFTLAKDNCWLKYDVTVKVVDANTDKLLTTVTIPAGQSWNRESFTCDKAEKLMFYAQFTPVIWESERGKVYSASNYWSLPADIKPGDKAWNVTACYASDFSQTPMPPEAINTCQCDFSKIPTIPLQ